MDNHQPIPGTCRVLRIREVLQLCGLSRATLYREIKLHSFPAPVKLSARSIGWLHDDVMRWMETRIAQRGPAYQAGLPSAPPAALTPSPVQDAAE